MGELQMLRLLTGNLGFWCLASEYLASDCTVAPILIYDVFDAIPVGSSENCPHRRI